MDFALVNFMQAAGMARAAAALLRRHVVAAGKAPRAVMLTGGQTIRLAYRHFARANACPAPDGFHLLGSDDRHVPRDSTESNFLAMRPVFDTLALPPARIIMPPPALELDAAADAWHAALAGFFDVGGRITLGLLGIGADGHVASLFNADDIGRAVQSGKYAIPVRRPQPPDRISVTPALLARIDLIIVLAAGPDKRAAIEKLMAGDASIPAVHALAAAPQVLVWYAAR